MKSLINKTRMVLQMIKFEHTIFALPFAMMSTLLAVRSPHGSFSFIKVMWILIAMIGARSAAMAFNRLIDADIDSKNPRTENRHIPAGILTKPQVTSFLLVSLVLFEVAAFKLNLLCFALSPVALLFILGYSYTKRFTFLCHIVLGFAIGIAPIGAWIAITGRLNLVPILLGAAVMCWIGGFDIIYAMQDYDIDLASELFSLPKFVGKAGALMFSRLLHVLTMALLIAVGVLYGMHVLYYVGVAVAGGLIAFEQSLVSPTDLSKVDLAFFTLNGWVSVSLFAFVMLDAVLIR